MRTARPDPEAAAGAGPRPVSRARLRRGRLDVKLSPYLYISPFFVLFLVVGLFPLGFTVWVALRDWNLIGGDRGFVGLANFTKILGEERFWVALRNTFSIFLLSSVPQVAMAVALAAVLDANLRAKTFWRMGVLVPYVVAPVAVSLIFSKMFADESGLINTVLGRLGAEPVPWHSSVLASHFAIACMVNFRWTGYNTLIVLAAMQAVPRDVYEASVIDGAGRFRQFFSVTIPMLRPTIIFVVITSTIGGLQIFDEPRVYDTMGAGGNNRQWMTLTLYLYQLGWGPRKSFGQASAVAVLLLALILVFAAANFLITRRIASAGAAPPGARGGRAEP
ncbi:MAG: sugar ABC transporter permease [Bifidobacteriaceae bacterium]|jgi:cellobiose transport system permease protein|nr:sugar ABC transporter permease [Bifidobacteriaceae bacterium]